MAVTDTPAPKPDEKPKPKAKPGKEEDPDSELSDEDRALKEKLVLLVERACDSDPGVAKLALETIRGEIRSATSSMTSVPKPLKFLRPHYPTLQQHLASLSPASENAKFLADVMSVLAMTLGDEDLRESLHFKLKGTTEAPHLWGHEFVRHLAGEIAREYDAITVPDSTTPAASVPATVEQLETLVDDIVPFLITSNAEPEAVDLLMEVDALEKLPTLTDEHNFARVCRYLKACASFTPDADEMDSLLSAAIDIYDKVGRIPDAMEVAIRLGNVQRIEQLYQKTTAGSAHRVQLALDLGRANVAVDDMLEDDENLRNAISNRKLSEYFQHLAKDLDVLEPKVPEDIYKTHLIDSRVPPAVGVSDSARANLASTFVNAFVNMGFGTDKLLSNTEKPWIYSNKDHGMMSATASLGMIMQWDVDKGLSEIDKYMYVDKDQVRAGALLSVGIVSACVRHEVDPAYALLNEFVTDQKVAIRNGAIAGLGIAYAGSNKEDIKELLSPIVADPSSSADTAALAALSLGLAFVGTADEDLTATLVQALSDRKDTPEVHTEALLRLLMPLALGLLFLGKQESVDAVIETINAMVGGDTLMGRVTATTIQACAYAGTGNVLKVQTFLSICGEHPSASDDDTHGDGAEGRSAVSAGASGSGDALVSNADPGPSRTDNAERDGEGFRTPEAEQAIAVLGIAMVAMGEELGAEMSLRAFGHLMQYGDPVIRRTVPLAIGLLSVSNPKLELMDMLSKFTHDADMDVAQSAIVALGLIGSGTNNSRIAGILRQLSSYYSKDPGALFLVRISQGLLHAAKGLVTMNPYYANNKFLCNNLALGGLLAVLFSCLDMKGTILGKSHYLLYFLSLSARPRMVFTVDEKMEFLPTTVRVGKAVDTVGQAGRPKSITGFQTHTTPVLLAAGEQAELATDEYIAVTSSLEGVVVLKKNPDWVEESGLEEAVAKASAEASAGKESALKASDAGSSSGVGGASSS